MTRNMLLNVGIAVGCVGLLCLTVAFYMLFTHRVSAGQPFADTAGIAFAAMGAIGQVLNKMSRRSPR